VAVVVTVAKSYDLGYVWKNQAQAGAERTTGGYYRGMWPGPGVPPTAGRQPCCDGGCRPGRPPPLPDPGCGPFEVAEGVTGDAMWASSPVMRT
jgi:hypothetical protein